MIAAILLLLVSIPLARQSDSGRLEGEVRERMRAALFVTASVKLHNVIPGMVVSCDTNQNGLYSIEDLRAARYSLYIRILESHPPELRSVESRTERELTQAPQSTERGSLGFLA